MSSARPRPEDLFELELPSAPAAARDGQIAYLRHRADRTEDRVFGELWTLAPDGSHHRRLALTERDIRSFAWSPQGEAIVYVARCSPLDDRDTRHRLVRLEVTSGSTSCVCDLSHEPRLLTWSPVGDRIAFVMGVPRAARERIAMPEAASDRWAPRARYVDELFYRMEGTGLIEHADALFVAELSTGEIQQMPAVELRGGGLLPATLAWRPDGTELLFASSLEADWQRHQGHSDIHAIEPRTGRLTRLTRGHVAACPAPSPDGRWIAYLGFEDGSLFHHQPHLWLMRADGSDAHLLLDIDRDLFTPAWDARSERVYFSYFDAGVDKIGGVDLQGGWHDAAVDIGGTAGPNINIFGTAFAVAPDFIVTTTSAATRPPDIALVRQGALRSLTALNPVWASFQSASRVEEIRYPSSLDGKEIQGWIVYPPGFDPSRRYPLIVEVHGGPNAAYGPKFSYLFQTWAAAGFVVFYPNYRGSTSYGREFVNTLQAGHPKHEHEDILSGVSAVESRGGIDPYRLFIAGASAGGTLTAWTIGHSNRFRAAVVMHPVINYSSFSLTWDLSALYARRWLPRTAWEDPVAAWAHSPLSRVGHVSTPTLVVVGAQDQRTPPGEGEQYYNALRQRGVEAALLIRDGVGHAHARPSQEIELNLHILGWFSR